MHSTTTYVGRLGLACPHMLFFLRLQSLKPPMMGTIFLSPRPSPKLTWLSVLTWFHIGMNNLVSLCSRVALFNRILFYLLCHLTT